MLPRLASNLSAVAALLSSDDARALIKKARSPRSLASSCTNQPTSAITNILLLQFPAPLSPPLRKKRGRPPNPSSLPHRVSHTMNISVNASPSHGLPSAESNSNRIVQQGQPDFFTPLMRVSPTNRSELRPRKQRSRKSTPSSFPTPNSPSFASMSPTSASRLHQVLQNDGPYPRPGLEPSAIDGTAFMNSLDPQHQFYITPPHLAKLLAETAASASASASASSSPFPKSSGPSLVRKSISHRTLGSICAPHPTSLTGESQYHSLHKDASSQSGYNGYSHKKALSVASSVTDVSDIDSFSVPSRLRSGSSYYDHGLSTPSMLFGTPSNRRLRLPPQPADDLLPPALFVPSSVQSQASPRPNLDFSLSLMVDALGKAALFSNVKSESVPDLPAQTSNMLLDEDDSRRRSASIRMDEKRLDKSIYSLNRENSFANQTSLAGRNPAYTNPRMGSANLDLNRESVESDALSSEQLPYESASQAINHAIAGRNALSSDQILYESKFRPLQHESSHLNDQRNDSLQQNIPADKRHVGQEFPGATTSQRGEGRPSSQVTGTVKDHPDMNGGNVAQSAGQVSTFNGGHSSHSRGINPILDDASGRNLCFLNRGTHPSSHSTQAEPENRTNIPAVRPSMDNRFMSDSALVRPSLQQPQFLRRHHSESTDTSAPGIFPGNLERQPIENLMQTHKSHSSVDLATLQNPYVETPQTPTTKDNFFYSSPNRNMQFAFTPLFNMASTSPQGNGLAHHQQPSTGFLMSQDLFSNRPTSSAMAHLDQVNDQPFRSSDETEEYYADQHSTRGGFMNNVGLGDDASQFKANGDSFMDPNATKGVHPQAPVFDGGPEFEYASPSSMSIHHLEGNGEYGNDHQVRATAHVSADDARLALKKVMSTRN